MKQWIICLALLSALFLTGQNLLAGRNPTLLAASDGRAASIRPPDKTTALPEDFLASLGGVKKISGTFGGGAQLEFRDGIPVIRFARGDEENKYAGMMFQLNNPVDLAGKSLQLLVRGDQPPGGLYLRAYAPGVAKPVWSFSSWSNLATSNWQPLFFQQGSAAAGFSWETAVVQPGGKADRIDRLEIIIGTQNKNETVDLQFKDVRIGDEKETLTSLAAAIPLPTDSILVKDRLAKTEILHPDTPAGREAARAIAAAIRQASGVTVPARPGRKADRVPDGNRILLGNLYNNPAMLTLYARGLTLADEMFPGSRGYIVESIVEPFRRGSDILLIGASDDSGLAAGAGKFIDLVRTAGGSDGFLELPHFFDYQYAMSRFNVPAVEPDFLAKGVAEAHRRLQTGVHTSLGGYLAEIGERYRLWHRAADAKLFVEVAKVYADSARSDPRKFGGPWGFDSDFRSFAAIGMWDIVEHDPALTAADRLAVTNMLCRWLLEAIAAEAAGGRGGTGVVSNHLTFASLGTLMGSVYIGKYYGDKLGEPAQWEAIVRHNFGRQNNSFKAHDDCNGYQWLTWHHLLLYSTAMPDDTFFLNGMAAKVIDSLLLTMDNLGNQVPYGDTGSWKCWNSEVICLEIYYAVTRDPLAAYLLSVKRGIYPGDNPGNFRGKLGKVETPVRFNGVQILPLDRKYYQESKDKEKPAPDRTFDKISFREKLDPQAFYLLSDGVNNGGHKHADANSVLRHTQFNRIWLADNDYFKSQQKFHNTLLVVTGGEAFPLPDFMELIDSGETEQFGWTATRANRLGPNLNWTRYLVYLKQEQAYLAIDEIQASQAADVILKQRWHGVGELDKTADGALLRQQGPTMRFQGEPGSRYHYFDDYELGVNWSGYPYASKIVRVIDQIREKTIPAGGRVRIGGVWHGNGAAEESAWQLEPTPDGYRVDTGRNAYLIDLKDGKAAIQETAASGSVKSAAATEVGASTTLPAIEVEHYLVKRSERLFNFTAPASRKAIPFQLTGTEPAKRNALVTSAANQLASAADGGFGDADDSVMFDQDRPVALRFDFERPIEVSRLRLRLWWSNASSTGDKFKLATAGLTIDGKPVNSVDTTGDDHPNFGTPVTFDLDFPVQTGSAFHLELTPQAGCRIYLAEVEINGPAPLELPLPDTFIEFTCLTPMREKRLAGTADGNLVVYAANGEILNEFKLKSGINDLAAADLDGDGKPEILAALENGTLAILNEDGKELREIKFEYYRKHPAVRIVRVADLDGDGKPEILAGCDNWRVYAFTAAGKELWNYEVIHPARAVAVSDLDGDGKPEVLCGTIYYQMSVLSNQGLLKWRGSFGPGCRAIVTPKTAAGKWNVAAGSDNGNLYFFNAQGVKLGEFATGDEVRTLAVAAANPDGSEDVFAGSFNGLVYRFGGDGKLKWYAAMPGSVTVVRALPDGSVLAGGSSGHLRLFSPTGKPVKELTRMKGEISAIDLGSNGRGTAVSRHGEITFFKF